LQFIFLFLSGRDYRKVCVLSFYSLFLS